MGYLILGVVLWCALHMVPAVPLQVRASLIARTDEVVYKGLFTVLTLGAVVLMVVGWKATPPNLVFVPPGWAAALTLFAMLVASILFLGPYLRSNLRRWVRHPQLTGLLLWSISHALATGQLRGLVLFGGLGVWSLVEMWLLNRRDGAWVKPDSAAGVADFRLLLAGLGFFALFLFTHHLLFGVSPVPAW